MKNGIEDPIASKQSSLQELLDAHYVYNSRALGARQYWDHHKPGSKRSKQTDRYWGLKNVSANGMEELGVKGRYCLPLYYSARDHVKRRSEKLKTGDFASAVYSQLPLKVRIAEKGLSDPDNNRFHGLFKRVLAPYPDVSVASDIANATIAAYCYLVKGTSEAAVRAIVENTSLKTPGDVYQALAKRFPVNISEGNNGVKSYIDPNLRVAIYKLRTGLSTSADALESQLKNPDGQNQVIFLNGPGYSGKSQIIQSLLRRWGMLENDQATVFPKSDHQRSLPVFAIECKNKNFSEVVEEVHRFVSKNNHLRDGRRYSGNLTAKLEMLQRLAHEPALYIFHHANVFENNFNSETLKYSFGILTKTLLRGAPDSRIIITSRQEIKPNRSAANVVDHLYIWDGMCAEIYAHQNKLDDVEYFVDEKHLSSIKRHILSMAANPEELSRLLKIPVEGSLMIAFAGMTQILGNVTTERVMKFIAALKSTGSHRPMLNHLEPVADFYIHLIKEVKDSDFDRVTLRAIALVVASNDGLMETSLVKLLIRWESIYGEKSQTDCLKKINQVIEQLKKFASESQQRLVRTTTGWTTTKSEWTVRETINHNSGQKLLTFSIDPPVRKHIARALEVADKRAFSISNQLIAHWARKRSRITKLNSHGIYGLNRADLKRDIQCYETLLGSIIPKGTDRKSKQQGKSSATNGVFPSLEHYIFDEDSRQNAVGILQFCYFTLLKEEIDNGNRLSVVMDEDLLRLRLLLQLFCPGKIPVNIEHAREFFVKGFTGPLAFAFTPLQQARILEDIAISAANADLFWIARDASDMLGELVKTIDKNDTLEDIPSERPASRPMGMVEPDLVGDRVKNAYLKALAATFESELAAKKSNFNENKGAVSEQYKEFGVTSSNMMELIGSELYRDICRRRLALLNLVYLIINGTTDSREVLKCLEQIEKTHRKIALHTNSPSGGIGGRTARIIAQVLIGDIALGDQGLWRTIDPRSSALGPIFLSGATGPDGPIVSRDSVIKLLDSLTDGATVRLSRYSGGDRGNILICEMLKNLLAENIEVAKHNYSIAEDHFMFPGVSVGLKMSLLWTIAQVNMMEILSLTSGNYSRSWNEREKIKTKIDSIFVSSQFILEIANSRQLEDYVARVRLLQARVAAICIENDIVLINRNICFQDIRMSLIWLLSNKTEDVSKKFKKLAFNIHNELKTSLVTYEESNQAQFKCPHCEEVLDRDFMSKLYT